ncbi:MAG TPA: AlkA N-terminal domain-containing protein [Gammaproteobacteria bacterium]|nr:AlkA N-terminal domain-containing protein [Gammaproteobacteria bacterium]
MSPGATARLATRAPFHLEATVRVLQRRPANPVDFWEGGRYLRALSTADGPALLEVRNRGTIDAPDVRARFRGAPLSPPARAALKRTVRATLGLDFDPVRLERFGELEDPLRSTAAALRGLRPPRFPSLFETFANVVPFQQVSLDAGAAIVGRLVARFGRSLDTGGRRFPLFPTATAIAGARLDALRGCGLSARKAETLRGLARGVASGEIDEAALARMPSSAALETLTALPGIGPWSAALVLLRGLGRLDVFPPGDVGASKALRRLLRLGPHEEVEHAVERFGPDRGYLYFYAIGSRLLAEGLIEPARKMGSELIFPRRGPQDGGRRRRPTAPKEN